MKLLHLCCDYSNTPLYNELITKINRSGYQQSVYIPVRAKNLINKNKNYDLSNTEYFYPYILNLYTRINYFHKIKKVFKNIINSISFNDIDLIHAHFLFSDGGVAYEIKKKYNIDYIVTVRNTDINVFFRYLYHVRNRGNKILENAKKIILISPKYEMKLKKYIRSKNRDDILSKVIVIPNGIDDFWLKNKGTSKTIKQKKEIKLLYVGEYSKNKNIESIIKVAILLKRSGYDIKLYLVGEYGDNVSKIKRLVKNNNSFITSFKKITEKNKLLDMYRNSDIFIMPSFHETFGLVFLEAMSQGLPIIYTRNEGIDGYYQDGVIGYSVAPRKTKEILLAFKEIIKNYSTLSKRCLQEVDSFSLKYNVEKHLTLYNNIKYN